MSYRSDFWSVVDSLDAGQLCRYFSDNDIDVNAESKFCETALMVAAGLDAPEKIEALLDAGALIDYKNKKGHSALLEAVRLCSWGAAEKLLSVGANSNNVLPDCESRDQIRDFVLNGNSYGGDVSPWRLFSLIVKNMDAGAMCSNSDISALATTCLSDAVLSGAGGDDIARLIAAGGNADAVIDRGDRLLHAAVYLDNYPAVEALMDGGASVRYRDSEGQYPLHLAGKRRREALCAAIISRMKESDISEQMEYIKSIDREAHSFIESRLLKALSGESGHIAANNESSGIGL